MGQDMGQDMGQYMGQDIGQNRCTPVLMHIVFCLKV